MKEVRILFTGAGRRVELIRAFREAAFVRSLPLVIYGCDMSGEAPVLAFCDRVRRIVAMKDPAYIDDLLAICKKDRIDLVIPTIDTDLLILSKNKDRFLSQRTRVLIGNEDKIALCRDKNKTGDFFLSCGLKAPATVHEVSDYQGPFPAFIKPKDGSSSIDAYLAKDEAALSHYAGMIKDYVIQPYIEGDEYTIDLCCDFEGRAIGIVPRRRLTVRAGEVYKTQISMDEAMIRAAERIIDAFRPCGPLTVQLIREKSTGDDYYIEINPRFGGGAPLSMKAGYDAAGALLDCIVRERDGGDGCVAGQEAVAEKAAQAAGQEAVAEKTAQAAGQEAVAEKTAQAAGRGAVAAGVMVACGNGVAQIEDGAIYHRFDDSVQVAAGRTDRPLAGIIFDLDDTLYPEKQYVRSGYEAVAKYLGDESLTEKMWEWFEQGLPAINHAIDHMVRPEEKDKCLEIYRTHAEGFFLYPGVREMLAELRQAGLKIGILTDGREISQNTKLDSLGLRELVDDIIITDALGGEQFRKPCDIGFRILQRKWRLPFAALGYAGDNLKKDFIAPLSLGMRAFYIENRDGLYYEADETEIFTGITMLKQVTDVRTYCLPIKEEADTSDGCDVRGDACAAPHGENA